MSASYGYMSSVSLYRVVLNTHSTSLSIPLVNPRTVSPAPPTSTMMAAADYLSSDAFFCGKEVPTTRSSYPKNHKQYSCQ